MIAKIRHFVKENQKIILDLFLFFLFFLAGFFSGIIIKGNIISRPPLIIDKKLLADISKIKTNNQQQNSISEFNYVASKRGKYYYPLDCPLSKNLKQENRIYFHTREEAEKQGYILNKRCLTH